MEEKKKDMPSARLLVVDDNEDNRDMLSRRLQKKGYEVDVAENGREALDKTGADSFDLILLDIMMPDIDGLKVLKALRKDNSSTQLPVIMTTARIQSHDIVEALQLGANDYVTKPIDFAVLLARLKTHLDLKRAHEELDRAYRRIKEDLEVAAGIQHALLPTSLPNVPAVQFAWSYVPCDELAGDILNVFKLDEHHVGLYLLDVSGHGVQAALLSSTLSRVLAPDGSIVLEKGVPPAAPRVVPPAKVLEALNRQFPMDLSTCQFFTILYGVIDLRTRRFSYVDAGHPEPVLVLRSGASLHEESTDPPVGFFEDVEFHEHSIDLQAGDRVYIYSDGVPEARNKAEEMFGYERLVQLIEACRSEGLDRGLRHMENSVREWAEAGVQDDISMLAFEMSDPQ